MRTVVFLLFAIAFAAHFESYANTFEQFAIRFDKDYVNEDEKLFRLRVFSYNMEWAEAHNAEGHSYKVGVTPFADMTNTEFQMSKLCGCMLQSSQAPAQSISFVADAEPIDWREKGAVMPMKDQARCGSCWAFSANVALEGGNFIFGVKKLIGLSEQQLVDCDPKSHGCNGGLMTNAFEYVTKHGLCSEKDYPYHAKDEDCKDDQCQSQIKITGYKKVPANNGVEVKAALQKQPLSVAVMASSSVWQMYKEGIIDSDACGTSLNHGVGLIGWKDTYLIVKNSWGEKWGMKGYVHILHKDSGMGICGINRDVSYPTF